jgi:hypothetical protein
MILFLPEQDAWGSRELEVTRVSESLGTRGASAIARTPASDGSRRSQAETWPSGGRGSAAGCERRSGRRRRCQESGRSRGHLHSRRDHRVVPARRRRHRGYARRRSRPMAGLDRGGTRRADHTIRRLGGVRRLATNSPSGAPTCLGSRAIDRVPGAGRRNCGVRLGICRTRELGQFRDGPLGAGTDRCTHCDHAGDHPALHSSASSNGRGLARAYTCSRTPTGLARLRRRVTSASALGRSMARLHGRVHLIG